MSKLREGRESKPQLVRLGHREIETLGLSPGFWNDLYHRSVTVYWPVFFGSAAAIFVTLNAVFAFFYWLGDRPIANVSDDLPLSLFYFSIETLATVGYGDMHPQTDYGHLVATVEIFTGMSFLAVMTGLVFARFSQPKARFVFARHSVVTTLNGQPTLMIRIANARHNTISQATARLWLFRLEHTKERDQLRRYYELKLFRQEHPMFSLSWTLVHIIDETSAFRDMTRDKFTEGRRRAGAQCWRRRRQFGAAALRPADLFARRHPLAAPLPRHHQPVGAGPSAARLHQIPRHGARE